jgi:molybdopterin/thiamine biosynthesis adenylyltransferase
MNFDHLTRQLDILPLDKLGEKITVIGAGAIGSWVVLALAKMGFSNIVVFDDDDVSVENMSCQFYPMTAIGQKKVRALAQMVQQFTGVVIEDVAERYEKGTFSGIVISAVDSMQVRRLIWENHKAMGFTTKFIIDPRMGAETALLYVMDPKSEKDITSYEKTLYSDNEAVQERCTAKATIYTANMLSGLVCKAVKDIVTDNPYPRISNWSIKDHDFLAYKAAANG